MRIILEKLAYGLYVTSAPLLRRYLNGTDRVRIVVILDRTHVLLVRGWVGRQKWNFPGGGIEGNETEKQAAVRELLEETGLKIEKKDLVVLSQREYRDDEAGICFTNHYYGVHMSSPAQTRRRRSEIIELAFVPLDALPHQKGDLVERVLSTAAMARFLA